MQRPLLAPVTVRRLANTTVWAPSRQVRCCWRRRQEVPCTQPFCTTSPGSYVCPIFAAPAHTLLSRDQHRSPIVTMFFLTTNSCLSAIAFASLHGASVVSEACAVACIMRLDGVAAMTLLHSRCQARCSVRGVIRDTRTPPCPAVCSVHPLRQSRSNTLPTLRQTGRARLRGCVNTPSTATTI